VEGGTSIVEKGVVTSGKVSERISSGVDITYK